MPHDPRLEPPSVQESPLFTPSALTRRKVLGMFGIAATGLAAVPIAHTLAPLLFNFDPARWRSRLAGPSASSFPLIDQENYTDFLRSQNLRHVTIHKILASHAKERNGVRNGLPPINLWANLIPTLKVAELLSNKLGEDVQIVISAYRTPDYNAMCPGSARNSQHLQNNALDLVFKSPPATVAGAARELRAQGLFRGGVGLYPTFTHIDTRGRNSDWQNI